MQESAESKNNAPLLRGHTLTKFQDRYFAQPQAAREGGAQGSAP